MSTLDELTAWINGYIRAWNSNDAADIAALFADDARYFTAPFRSPWQGVAEIVEGWLDRRDEPGDADFTWEPLVLTPELAIVQGRTAYRKPAQVYSNLWVIRLDEDGRCREFIEWWMEHRDTEA